MNSNQRSQANNQSDNGGNEKAVSSSRGGTVEKDLDQQSRQQGQPGQKQSNDLAGGLPRSPAAGPSLNADQNMNDDTGLSNRANRQSPEQDQGNRQSAQSNVGRRDDGTPD